VKGDYKYETTNERYEPIDHLLDNYRVRLAKSYHKIDSILDTMDEYLRRAGDYPADISKEDAIQVQAALEEIGMVLQKYESLFNGMDDF